MGAFARRVLGMKEPTKLPIQIDVKKRAREIISCNDNGYFKDLLRQIEKAATAPIVVSDSHAKMVEQAGKTNAYRELVEILRADMRKAEALIAEDYRRERS